MGRKRRCSCVKDSGYALLIFFSPTFFFLNQLITISPWSDLCHTKTAFPPTHICSVKTNGYARHDLLERILDTDEPGLLFYYGWMLFKYFPGLKPGAGPGKCRGIFTFENPKRRKGGTGVLEFILMSFMIPENNSVLQGC
jgi:hypothetical protein